MGGFAMYRFGGLIVGFALLLDRMSQVIENPFAVSARRSPSRLLASIKGLAMVAGLFALLVVAQAQSRRWLLERWATGFSDLPVAEQVERLLQIDALGDIATETVARRLAAEEDTVAATAYELLRERLSEWSSRDDASLGRAHQNMIAGLEAIAPELDGDRARWASELLNQTLIECAERNIREVDDAFLAATRVLALVVPPSSDNGLDEGDSLVAATLASQTISTGDGTVRPRLVPLAARVQQVEGSALPPVATMTERTPVVSGAVASTQEPDSQGLGSQELGMQPTASQETDFQVAGAVPMGAAKVITVTKTADATSLAVQPARHLTKSPYEAFDTKSVISLLGSNQADVHDLAVEELVRRGLNNEEIRVANQLASPVVEVRLGLLESIVNRTDIDPRPWLLWLAEDPQSEVRMRAITTLATMDDATVKQSLRRRLPYEHDPTVIAHIRRVVGVR
jgi:hypothetical protein